MADQRVTVDQMADAIMDGLLEYAELATDTMKDCVKKVGNTVKKETQANAPVKSGRYKKSWAVKRQKETSTTLEMVVHSRNRYQLTHLLEKGHAKRGGGRVKALPHIGPAEEKGIRMLENSIRKGLSK
ncbi:HK97 gp10 family phage protein [[Clostridium] symbiosum]|uniref:HK97 gp10 family phage protein n=1 Tax=Clostridium symbiosum TaxID=1512 RepID=UPI0006C7B72D|nr:HK97 gp10 family phage protein [[Clostridium] symbiosum]MDB2038313.1 HK97 gp10 family phage protein [[Clostridium] symbiosum]DAT32655.1 MAG TPA: putative tail component [Caudoviricetes sp.]